MSRDVSLTVLSKNTSTSNTDEILENGSAVLSRDGISNILATSWSCDLYGRNSRRFAISRLPRGVAPYEPNLGRLITNGVMRRLDGIEFIWRENDAVLAVQANIIDLLSNLPLHDVRTSVEIAKWRNSTRSNALWLISMLLRTVVFQNKSIFKKGHIILPSRCGVTSFAF